jgi:hypothetical protein
MQIRVNSTFKRFTIMPLWYKLHLSFRPPAPAIETKRPPAISARARLSAFPLARTPFNATSAASTDDDDDDKMFSNAVAKWEFSPLAAAAASVASAAGASPLFSSAPPLVIGGKTLAAAAAVK